MTVQGQIRLSWVMTVASGLVMAAAAALLGRAVVRADYFTAAFEIAIGIVNAGLICWQSMIRQKLNRLRRIAT